MTKHPFLQTLIAMYSPKFDFKEEIFFIVVHWLFIKKGFVENVMVRNCLLSSKFFCFFKQRDELFKFNRTGTDLRIAYWKSNMLIETQQYFLDGKYFLCQYVSRSCFGIYLLFFTFVQYRGHNFTSSLCTNEYIHADGSVNMQKHCLLEHDLT